MSKHMRYLLVAAVLFAASGCSASEAAPYDEAAHRATLEKTLGHPVSDWPTVLQLSRETCAYDEKRFALQIAVNADRGMLDETRIDVAYVCPDRSAELERISAVTPPG